ncbi:PH domain-containing protein [Corynebacterium heidelbergense]|uniref:PH domain-containing protein n=1 Tax=Corynebacterium heidelbergense TaxID=2055947 RepID=UPI0026BD2565
MSFVDSVNSSADTRPADTEGWQLTVTSPYLRKVAIIAAVVVMAAHIFMAIVVGVGNTGVAVTPADQFAFVGIGLIFSACCLALLRPRVRAGAAGVEVRNIANAQFYPWEIIYGLSFPASSRNARLELPDFEFVPMLAFYIKDKDVAAKVERFRQLEDAYMPDED